MCDTWIRANNDSIYTPRGVSVLFAIYDHLVMLLQNVRAKIHESRFGCHASLTGYITAMKPRTGTPAVANPHRILLERDCVLTWVYYVSRGMICSIFMVMT